MENKKLNICLLNDAFPPAIDGVANVVVNYAKEFDKAGSKVIVGTPDYPEASYDYPFEVLRYPSVNTIKQIGYVTGYPFEIKYISQFIDKDIDIIHTHCPMTSNYLARVLRDIIHKPVVFTYHTKYDIDIDRALKGNLIKQKAIKMIVDNISACDEVWAVSKGAADNLRSLGYKGEIIIMENGVDMPKGRADEKDIQLVKEEYQIKDNLPTYLFVGRMMWYKGIRIILDALDKLKENHKEFQMLFVGSGVEFEDIKAYAKEKQLDDYVKFIGPINDRNKLKTFFSLADIFIFPSTFDTNGLVVREAASSGLGSILIEGSCAAEGTVNNKNALYIEETADSLYELLNKTDVSTYKKIGENAMNDLYLSWEDATKKAYERYELLLKNYQYKDNRGIKNDLLKAVGDGAELLKKSEDDFMEFKSYINIKKENHLQKLNEIKERIKR